MILRNILMLLGLFIGWFCFFTLFEVNMHGKPVFGFTSFNTVFGIVVGTFLLLATPYVYLHKVMKDYFAPRHFFGIFCLLIASVVFLINSAYGITISFVVLLIVILLLFSAEFILSPKSTY